MIKNLHISNDTINVNKNINVICGYENVQISFDNGTCAYDEHSTPLPFLANIAGSELINLAMALLIIKNHMDEISIQKEKSEIRMERKSEARQAIDRALKVARSNKDGAPF